ncbi:MAG: hypothetical protein FRX49_03711 [Trebouxia sp. A1-2]|nr:MAG: hypothetical protein FRX49_03711 [Trebouxia sp. A1-2]
MLWLSSRQIGNGVDAFITKHKHWHEWQRGKDLFKGTVCQLLATSYLKPVNGAAVDKGWVLAQPVPEGIADGAEAQHHMQALLALLHEEAPHFHRALQPKLASSWPHHLQHLPTAHTRRRGRREVVQEMTSAAHLEDFHATDEGCQTSQALAATAAQTHQQHVAPRLTEHTADAAHMLHSKEEHGQQPQPVIVINQAVIEDPEDLMHPEALIHRLSSLSRNLAMDWLYMSKVAAMMPGPNFRQLSGNPPVSKCQLSMRNSGPCRPTGYYLMQHGEWSSPSLVRNVQGSKDHTCGKVASQETKRGFQPSWWGSRYTMPQRLTVAGEATAKSPTCMGITS